jgi:hypothetical protein
MCSKKVETESENFNISNIDVSRILSVHTPHKNEGDKNPYTIIELKEIGKSLNIPFYHKLAKQELVSKILENLEQKIKTPQPLSIYNKFMAEELPKYKKEHPNISHSIAFKAVVEMWILDPRNPKNALDGKNIPTKFESEEEEVEEIIPLIIKKSSLSSATKLDKAFIKVGDISIDYNDIDLSTLSQKDAAAFMVKYQNELSPNLSEKLDVVLEKVHEYTKYPTQATLAIVVRRMELLKVVEKLDNFMMELADEDSVQQNRLLNYLDISKWEKTKKEEKE